MDVFGWLLMGKSGGFRIAASNLKNFQPLSQSGFGLSLNFPMISLWPLQFTTPPDEAESVVVVINGSAQRPELDSN